MAMNGKYTETEASQRDTKITTQYPRDNSDDQMNEAESRHGHDLAGGPGNLSRMISGGKVPME